jgi:hypothetical protein
MSRRRNTRRWNHANANFHGTMRNVEYRLGYKIGVFSIIQIAKTLALNKVFFGSDFPVPALAHGLMAIPLLFILDETSLELSLALVAEIIRRIAGPRKDGPTILQSEQNSRSSRAIACALLCYSQPVNGG